MRKKNLIIISMLMIVAIMSIGYAYFATTLNITTTGNISSSWNVKFTAMSAGDANGTKATSLSSSYTDTTATMSVDLKEPGDEMTYELTLTNLGDITAVIEDINAEATGAAAIIFSIDGIKEKDTLAKNETRTIKVKIEFDKSVTSQPSETTKTLTLSIRAVQLVDQDTANPTNPSIDQPMYLSSAILNNNIAKSDNGLDILTHTGTGLYYTNQNTENNGTTYYFRGNVDNNYVDFGNIINVNKLSVANLGVGSYMDYDENGEPIGEVAYFYIDAPCTDDSCSNKEICQLNKSIEYDGTNYDYFVVTSSLPCGSTFELDGTTYSSTSTGLTYSTENIEMQEKIYWRIVRINEDGSIRLILDGLGIDFSGSEYYCHGDFVSFFNVSLSEVSTWYENNLKTNYSQYLSNSTGFCRDLTYTTVYDEDAAMDRYNYGSKTRLTANKSQFACPRNQDLLTMTNASTGSKSLTNPVGLLSADEVAYAGGGSSSGKTYLSSGLTLSPQYWSGSNYSNDAYAISNNGNLSTFDFCYSFDNTIKINPVINLRADILISGGNGTSTNPYIIKNN